MAAMATEKICKKNGSGEEIRVASAGLKLARRGWPGWGSGPRQKGAGGACVFLHKKFRWNRVECLFRARGKNRSFFNWIFHWKHMIFP